MVIAVTYNQEDGTVGEHFGHATHFKLYEAEDGVVFDSAVVTPVSQGHDAMVAFLLDYSVDLLICQNIGGGAMNGLNEVGILVCPNVEGAADDAIEAFFAGNLQISDVSSCGCDHSAGGHDNCGHSTGGHSCCGHAGSCSAPGSCCH